MDMIKIKIYNKSISQDYKIDKVKAAEHTLVQQLELNFKQILHKMIRG